MYLILWEYKVRPDKVEAFEEFYGSEGAWAKLFAKAEGFLGTTLSKKLGEDNVYLTEDRWETRERFERFSDENKAEYARLDVVGDELTESEVKIGAYEIL